MAASAPRAKRSSFLALATLAVVTVAAGTTLGGCRNWCHTSQGVQPKAGATGTCTTPADHANATHRS